MNWDLHSADTVDSLKEVDKYFADVVDISVIAFEQVEQKAAFFVFVALVEIVVFELAEVIDKKLVLSYYEIWEVTVVVVPDIVAVELVKF